MIDEIEGFNKQQDAEDRPYQHSEQSNIDHEYVHAKAFLQKGSTETGDNLYDHLTDVLNRVLAERPENVIDFFEEYSRKVKEKRFQPLTDHLEDIYVAPLRHAHAVSNVNLYRPLPPSEPSTVDPDDIESADMSGNNLLDMVHYFEQAGIGLPRGEMLAITLAMRKLAKNEPIVSIRFWGKIFGIYKSYVIVETELRDQEYIKRNEKYAEQEELLHNMNGDSTQVEQQQQPYSYPDSVQVDEELEGEDGNYLKPDGLALNWSPVPKPEFPKTPEPPPELSGIGLNKKVYYVCNDPTKEWYQLPDVLPKQVRIARQITRSFSGNLDAEVYTYPRFEGTEKNLLRAQIARISSATHISPLGYYTFSDAGKGEADEEDESPGDIGGSGDYKVNPKYEPHSFKDLMDSSMMFWVHYTPFILNQGRTTWWNPNPLPDVQDEEDLGGEEEEDLGEKEKNEVAGEEPESGPHLLTPCSEDVMLDSIPAWSVKCSSLLMAEEYGLVIVRSNFWPGAFCFTKQGKLFQNVYFGNGLKATSPNFSPRPLPAVQQEYPMGPEIMEMADPTGHEEEQWRIDHLPKEKPPLEMMGEEQMPEEAEEEEDEEDEEDD